MLVRSFDSFPARIELGSLCNKDRGFLDVMCIGSILSSQSEGLHQLALLDISKKGINKQLSIQERAQVTERLLKEHEELENSCYKKAIDTFDHDLDVNTMIALFQTYACDEEIKCLESMSLTKRRDRARIWFDRVTLFSVNASEEETIFRDALLDRFDITKNTLCQSQILECYATKALEIDYHSTSLIRLEEKIQSTRFSVNSIFDSTVSTIALSRYKWFRNNNLILHLPPETLIHWNYATHAQLLMTLRKIKKLLLKLDGNSKFTLGGNINYISDLIDCGKSAGKTLMVKMIRFYQNLIFCADVFIGTQKSDGSDELQNKEIMMLMGADTNQKGLTGIEIIHKRNERFDRLVQEFPEINDGPLCHYVRIPHELEYIVHTPNLLRFPQGRVEDKIIDTHGSMVYFKDEMPSYVAPTSKPYSALPDIIKTCDVFTIPGGDLVTHSSGYIQLEQFHQSLQIYTWPKPAVIPRQLNPMPTEKRMHHLTNLSISQIDDDEEDNYLAIEEPSKKIKKD